MKYKVLIIGTVPYRKDSPARALDSFFHFWPKENLIQFFSDRNAPLKGHCSSLFQITDSELLKRRFKKKSVGTVFFYDNLDIEKNQIKQNDKKNNFLSFLYKIGKKRTPLTHLIRKKVWKKKYWLTEDLINWVDDFKPNCIFLCISDDFFIQDVGLFFANKYNIPIVCQIDDDYIFDRKFSINPFYHIYKSLYEKQIQEIMNLNTTAVYICNKIRDAYNNKYNISGETIYLSSEIKRRPFKPVDVVNPLIVYFGSIRLDRYKSLIDIADALREINSNYFLVIYSGETDSKFVGPLQSHPNIIYKGAIPYSEVKEIIFNSDVLIVTEGFSKFAIRSTRFSLSTKISDAITSGTNVFAYGPKESGAIDYLVETNAAMVCSAKSELRKQIKLLVHDINLQKKFYSNSERVLSSHTVENSSRQYEKLITNIIENKNDKPKQIN